VLQACDYLNLFEKYGCRLQIGGSDQWGNITAGVDLIRRVKREEVYALSIPLVTKADGTKFGKTETETVWLSSKKTTPYEFYQFWINIDDREVVKLLKYFTFLSQEKIEKLGQQVKDNPAEREAQRVLAREVTEITHGKEATARAEKISDALFYGNIRELNKEEIKEGFKNVSSYEIKNKNELELVELLVEAGVVSSKRQAREDIKNGAIYINGKQEMDTGKILQFSDRLFGEYIVIRRGKRSYYVIRWY
jgi:tyrosyl-tRNA synthetase